MPGEYSCTLSMPMAPSLSAFTSPALEPSTAICLRPCPYHANHPPPATSFLLSHCQAVGTASILPPKTVLGSSQIGASDGTSLNFLSSHLRGSPHQQYPFPSLSPTSFCLSSVPTSQTHLQQALPLPSGCLCLPFQQRTLRHPRLCAPTPQLALVP